MPYAVVIMPGFSLPPVFIFCFPFPGQNITLLVLIVSPWKSKNSDRRKVRDIFSPSQQLLEVVLVGFAAPLNRLKLSSGDFPMRMQRKCMLELLVFLSNVM